jgi:hypothetical protein
VLAVALAWQEPLRLDALLASLCATAPAASR